MDFTQFRTDLEYFSTVANATVQHYYTSTMFEYLFNLPVSMWKAELMTSDWRPGASTLTWIDISEFYLGQVALQDATVASDLQAALEAEYPDDFFVEVIEDEPPVDPEPTPEEPKQQ